MQKIGSSNKSVIMVYMAGAPPHQDLIDPKPDAPKEVRSVFRPIRTNVTGIHLNESLPMLAKVMNKWTGIKPWWRSAEVMIPSCATRGEPDPPFRPSLSHRRLAHVDSSLSKLAGSRKGILLSLALLPGGHPPYGSPGEPSFTGNRPWSVSSDRSVFGRHEAGLRSGSHRPQAISFGRIRFFPQILSNRTVEQMDSFTREAFGVLGSSKLAKALDLKEDPRVRERYGKGDPASGTGLHATTNTS